MILRERAHRAIAEGLIQLDRKLVQNVSSVRHTAPAERAVGNGEELTDGPVGFPRSGDSF
jgi:hypothetical protein